MFFNPIMNYYMQYQLMQSYLNPFAFSLNAFNHSIIYRPVSVFQRPAQYNRVKGEALLSNALKGLPGEEPNPPMCAKYVKNAIVNTGIGEYINGNGEQAKYMLRNNLNFREIKVNKDDLENLPEGTVLVYDANEPVSYSDGSQGKISEHGHVTIKNTDNTAVCDRIEDLPLSDRAYVFIPI